MEKIYLSALPHPSLNISSRDAEFFLFCSLLYPQFLEECPRLATSLLSGNECVPFNAVMVNRIWKQFTSPPSPKLKSPVSPHSPVLEGERHVWENWYLGPLDLRVPSSEHCLPERGTVAQDPAPQPGWVWPPCMLSPCSQPVDDSQDSLSLPTCCSKFSVLDLSTTSQLP